MEIELPLEKNLLIIGGTGRNVGKTSLALLLLKKFNEHSIIGLKVSAHRKEEELFHGTHVFYPADNFRITEENCIQPWKDTAQMLNAGASKAFYIEAASNNISEAYKDFKNNFNPENLPVICESRSLRKHLIPGINILLIDTPEKISDLDIAQADIVFYYKQGLEGLHNVAERINLSADGWTIKSDQKT